MISVSDFRNGVTFDMDGKVMQIIEFQHVKPGKGAAFVRVKMRNVITGGVTELLQIILIESKLGKISSSIWIV